MTARTMAARTQTEPVPIVPPGTTREPVRLPEWFDTAPPASGGRPTFRILLSDSQGENIEDLLLAWQVNMADRRGAFVMVGDDQRNPTLCTTMIDTLIASDRAPDAVVGHFSSPVARAAAAVYRRHGIPFFAPGASADDLASDAESPTFQMFGRDAGQVSAIAAQLASAPGAIALGQPGNAGASLLESLRRAVGSRLRAFAHFADVPSPAFAGRPLVLLGSKEYVADAISALDRAELWPSEFIISDDALGSERVVNAAARSGRPARVAALRRDPASGSLLGFDTESVEREAHRVLGRAPGPYYLTAWASIYLALKALAKGLRHPRAVLSYLQCKDWPTPYGRLRFTDTGQAQRFEWELRRIA